MDLRKNQSPPQSFENRLKCFSEMVFSDKHNLFQFQFLELSYCDYYQNVCSVFSFWLCQKVPSFHCVFGVLWDYSYEMVFLVMFHLAVIERTHVLLVNYHNFLYILCNNFSFDLLQTQFYWWVCGVCKRIQWLIWNLVFMRLFQMLI